MQEHSSVVSSHVVSSVEIVDLLRFLLPENNKGLWVYCDS